METPLQHERIAPEITPYLLSRDYEDHLDWLENQRRTRSGGGGAFGFLRFFSVGASFASMLALMARTVRLPRG